MRETSFQIGQIPALLCGDEADKVYLFVHGRHGCKEEGRAFAEAVGPLGWQVLAIDLPEHGERTGQRPALTPGTRCRSCKLLWHGP